MGGGTGTGGIGGALGCFEQISLAGELGGSCREGGTTCNTGFDCVPELPDPIGGTLEDYVDVAERIECALNSHLGKGLT